MEVVMDEWDFEALMQEELDPAWQARVGAAQGRVAAFNTKTPAEQAQHLRKPCDDTCSIPVVRRLALLPLD